MLEERIEADLALGRQTQLVAELQTLVREHPLRERLSGQLMSPAIGPIAVLPRDGSGPFLPPGSEVSPDTQKLVDAEVRRIVEESHKEVLALLEENRDKLDSLATALLKHETLDEEDAYAAAGVARSARRSAEPLSAAARSQVES